MAVIDIWCWIAGETPDGEQVLGKCLLAETPPANAWHAQQDADAWREEIIAELNVLDTKSIRALREGNAARIAEIEARAEQLRGWLRAIANA